MPDNSIDDLIAQIKDARQTAWSSAQPPATPREAQTLQVQDRFRELSLELIQRGVSSAILEGAFLVYWLKVACAQRFEAGGFEVCLNRVGEIMKPIYATMERFAEEVQDEGPSPEMKVLERNFDKLRQTTGASFGTFPKSRDIALAEQELAFNRIQPLLLQLMEEGIPASVLESVLFYFWFRSTAINHNLQEGFFQKLERHWDSVMECVNLHLEYLPQLLR